MANDKDSGVQWKFVDEDDSDSSDLTVKTKPPRPVSWTISESMFETKSITWYLILAAAAIVFAGLVYLFTRDKITTGVIIVTAIVLGYYAGHKLTAITYKLEEDNLRIDTKQYRLGRFRSFFVIEQDKSTNFILIPLKRFSPAITLYANPKDGEKVLDVLNHYLPIDKNREDIVDRFMRRINF